jgi:citrate synthase
MGYAENFLYMLDYMHQSKYEVNPVLAKALDVLFILHADHEQNASTSVMRSIGSAHADPYSAMAGAAAALFGPRHGGANEAVIKMLARDRRRQTRADLCGAGQEGRVPADGLRPSRLQEL